MAEDTQGASREIAERVRANVLPGLIGAGLLLYFGFVRLSEPTGTGLFESANWWFFHALRIGGMCMAVVAGWSVTGHRTALLADAVVAFPLGAVFVLTGPAMLIGGGETLNGALITIFGAMFLSEGVRNGRAFLNTAAWRSDAPRRVDSTSIRSERGLGTPRVDKPPVAAAPSGTDAFAMLHVEPPAPGGYLAAFAKKPTGESSADADAISRGS